LVAATVKVDEPPAVIDVGFAPIVTVGAMGAAETVIVAEEDTLPPVPVAFTVYVVVAEGVTDCFPPVAAIV
jgi:hypothetical protein